MADTKLTFTNYHFKSYLTEALTRLHFETPTKVQALVIPRALKKESLMVESATGSGKTHAYLLPILQNLIEENNEVQAVIISPTRELATQLYQVALELTKSSNQEIIIAKAIGGSDREMEIKRFGKSQPHLVIGTIGKILDLVIHSNVLKIHNAKTVVIDEADMIFEAKEMLEVDQIMGKVQGKPQFLIFSATLPKGLRHFLRKYLEQVDIISIEEKALTTKNIEHWLIPCKARNRETVLLELLEIIHPYLALIFVNTKEKVDELALFLAKEGYPVGKLHGDMDDRDRKQMLRRIQKLEFQYVVASDIAARGIDIEGVSHVINFDLPQDVEFYIHRTGRTARFTNTGIAYSLYAYQDDQYIKLLQEKGLKPRFVKIQHQEMVETKLFPTRPVSITKQMEQTIHQSVRMPQKVKPGYRKKRKAEIDKKLRHAKRERIQEIYRSRAKQERGSYENR